MIKKITLITTLLIVNNLVTAQNKKQADRNAIKSMCGCFEVGFNFAETFNYSKDSTYKPSKTKHETALEYAELVTDEENKIVIQHLLVVGKPKEEAVIKHWRQDWLYENTDLFTFEGNRKWNYAKKTKEQVKGQWTQKVYQVDDSPRYEGSSSWVHVDGKSFWENITNAPLPRREYTIRKDYNITQRGNRQEITTDGWVHDQNNKKIIRKQGSPDFILAEEKGFNTYKKVEESRCEAAKKWWKENKALWKKVRDQWDDVYNKKENISLKKKIKGRKLYRYMFKLKPDAKQAEIKKIITDFVE